MFYFEDTTTEVNEEEKDDSLVIVDGTTRQEIEDTLREQRETGRKDSEDTSITLLDRLRKLM